MKIKLLTASKLSTLQTNRMQIRKTATKYAIHATYER